MTNAAQGTSPASYVSGWGKYAPENIVTNAHFESYLDTSDQWIRERTGIEERRWAEPNTPASDLAAKACKEALDRAGLAVEDIDGVIVATVSADYAFPSTACRTQAKLGIKHGFAFDVNAACTGFVYAMSIADSMIRAGHANHLLVVGSEVFSGALDQNDRNTCILFGDGAGAVVLSATSKLSGNQTEGRGVIASLIRADGEQGEILRGGFGSALNVSAEKAQAGEHFLYMEGREVFKFAVRSLAEVSRALLEKTGTKLEDVSYVLSHQANQRILDGLSKQLGLSSDKVLSNVAKYGNTSAATVPILLCEAINAGTIQHGDLLLLNAVGGGLTWGAMLLRF